MQTIEGAHREQVSRTETGCLRVAMCFAPEATNPALVLARIVSQKMSLLA